MADRLGPVDDLAGMVDGSVVALAPEIGRWLFGPEAATVASAVRQAVEAATGTAAPEQQQAALGDPRVAGLLRVRLAAIAAAEAARAEKAAEARLAAQLAAAVAARAGADEVAQAGTMAVWGAPVISLVVLLTFGGVVAMTLLRSIPQGAEAVLNVLLGTLGAMATSVVGYWVGSSAGSARKDARLATLAERSGPS